MTEVTMPVTSAMIDALEPQPGMVLLELAAGLGDVGFMAAELIQPGGELITSDFAPEMLTAAQERAGKLGVRNVRFKQIDAHSIDLEAASVDGVLCRWGYMLMIDPQAALRETRRVLKPGARLVLAVWGHAEENPWSSVVRRRLQQRGVLEPERPGAPGIFALADPERVRELLDGAGFYEEVELRAVDVRFPYPDVETYIQTVRDMGTTVREGLAALDDAERAGLVAAVTEDLEPFRRDDGSYLAPGLSWVVTATA